jgi:hypothetical protein
MSDTQQIQIRWHPFAESFPMMEAEELQELAASIKTHGLQHPIVLDKDGLGIDGRNRFAGCRIAGVEPTYTTLEDGIDPIDYMLRSNVERRHLNKGQCAIAAVRAHKLQVTCNVNRLQLAKDVGINREIIRQAFLVEEYAHEQGDQVLAGSVSLESAHKEAINRRYTKQKAVEKAETLRVEAPHLLTMVKEDKLTLAGAWIEYEEELQSIERNRAIIKSNTHNFIHIFSPGARSIAGVAKVYLDILLDESFHGEDLPAINNETLPEELRSCVAVIQAIAEGIEKARA